METNYFKKISKSTKTAFHNFTSWKGGMRWCGTGLVWLKWRALVKVEMNLWVP
jgi:hypothetical protein